MVYRLDNDWDNWDTIQPGKIYCRGEGVPEGRSSDVQHSREEVEVLFHLLAMRYAAPG